MAPFGGTGALPRPACSFGGQLLASSDGFFYLVNTRGDVVALVSETDGSIKGYYTYDAFGGLRGAQKDLAVFNKFKFAGGLRSATGNYVFGARLYAPGEGRWISPDPYRGSADDPLSLNRYAYCSGDPINLVDPTGFASVDALLRSNAGWSESNRSIIGVLLWIWRVKAHGTWDYKNVDGFKGQTFEWNGLTISAEQLGNINFGLTGAAIGFDEEELICGSALANAIWGKQQSPWTSTAKGDSYEDIFYVALGYYYYGVIQGKYDFQTAIAYALIYTAESRTNSSTTVSQPLPAPRPGCPQPI